ncbi:MAG: hypothetical protein WCF67_08915 [Chitinophagaceae bacterium]
MKQFLGLLAGIVLFVACNSGGDKQVDDDSTTDTSTSDTTVSFTPVDTSAEFIETFSSNLQPWLERTTKQNTLRLDNFRYADNWVEDSLIVSPATNLTPEFYKTFKHLLIYSPDSTKVLDMGTYGSMVTKDSDGKVVSAVQGEPDSEIAVLDRKTRNKRRIFFFGPGTSVEQGFWINDSTIVLAGKTEEQNALKPMIWTVRLEEKSNFFKRYEPKQ